MNKAYKYRLYPNKEQTVLINKTFGCVRFIYNQMLANRKAIYKWYPSSKICHFCMNENKELTLADRNWTCPNCGAELDRDVNAAINIKNEGCRILGIA